MRTAISPSVLVHVVRTGVVHAIRTGVVHAIRTGVVHAIRTGVVHAIRTGVVHAMRTGVLHAIRTGVVHACTCPHNRCTLIAFPGNPLALHLTIPRDRTRCSYLRNS